MKKYSIHVIFLLCLIVSYISPVFALNEQTDIDGIRYTASGTKVARGQELGVMWVDFIMGDIYTYYKSLSKWFLDFGDAAINTLKNKLFSNAQMDRYLANSVDLNKLSTYATSTKWSPDQVDEAVTLARGLEKAKGTSAVKQMLDNGYSIEDKSAGALEKSVDLVINNVGGKVISMEAEGFDVMLDYTWKIGPKLDRAGEQLATAGGERIAVVVAREGTTLSEQTIRTAVTNWWNSGRAYTSKIDSVVFHVDENIIYYITK